MWKCVKTCHQKLWKLSIFVVGCSNLICRCILATQVKFYTENNDKGQRSRSKGQIRNINCQYLMVFGTLLLTQFSTYRHAIIHISYVCTKLQVTGFLQLELKSQGHRGEIISFQLVYNNSKSFHSIFTIFSSYIKQVGPWPLLIGDLEIWTVKVTAGVKLTWNVKNDLIPQFWS